MAEREVIVRKLPIHSNSDTKIAIDGEVRSTKAEGNMLSWYGEVELGDYTRYFCITLNTESGILVREYEDV